MIRPSFGPVGETPAKPSLLGKYPGVVTAADQATMQVRIKVPLLFGDQELPAAAWPCLPPAATTTSGSPIRYQAPMPGAGVWVEFLAGDPDHPIWVGTYEVS